MISLNGREAKRNEKAEAARLRAEELEREKREAAERAEAEEARAAEEAAELRKVRQREKKALQKERQQLRRLCSGIGMPLCSLILSILSVLTPQRVCWPPCSSPPWLRVSSCTKL